MHHLQHTVKYGKRGGSRKLARILAWTMLGCAGCTGHQLASKDQPGDPLLGPAPPPSVQPAATTQTGGLAPIPQNTGLTTTAALASQTPAGQTLAIPNGDGWARKPDTQGTPAGSRTPATPTSAPKVEAIPKETSATASPIQPTGMQPTAIQPTAWTSGSPTSAAPTADQIDKLLADHGVVGKDVQNVPGGVHVTCVVRTSPTTVVNHETTAVDYFTAAQAIIREIEAQPTQK
jgi:hypothetical protein